MTCADQVLVSDGKLGLNGGGAYAEVLREFELEELLGRAEEEAASPALAGAMGDGSARSTARSKVEEVNVGYAGRRLSVERPEVGKATHG